MTDFARLGNLTESNRLAAVEQSPWPAGELQAAAQSAGPMLITSGSLAGETLCGMIYGRPAHVLTRDFYPLQSGGNMV